MGAKVQIPQAQQELCIEGESLPQRWNISSLVAFRFYFVYIGLFCLSTQILGSLSPIPNVDIPDLSSLWPMRQITFWVAAHVFHAKLPLVYTDSGSGDKTFDWVLVFWLLVAALLVAGLWSLLDRKRDNHIALRKWFRLFIRFALAGQLLIYGMSKVVPLQMPFPYLTRMIEPLRDFSPMGVLWSSIGASPAYEMFAGSAELLAGILLIFPRTTMLGALIAAADMIQVFMLNMTYDVPVKLLSFHLLLLALLLLAPEFHRLADFLFRNRTAAAPNQPALFQSPRANRIALGVQIVFGLWLLGANAYGSHTSWHTYGGGRIKSPLYGIWNVDELWIDGQIRSPLLTDYDRWRRAIFDFPDSMIFQRMDDSFAYYGVSINMNDKTITLSKGRDKNWKGNFNFQQDTEDRLLLDGNMGGHKMHLQLQLVDRSKFMLVSRGFHWIQEYPFNR
jgi:uncharacterized membrane protein YphA (DoxX/SURF4 family)